MALRPIWIATQGLTIGLRPVVVAIQGLWPDEEEDEQPIHVFGGGGGRVQPTARDKYMARQKRLLDENMNRIAMLCAMAVEEYL